MLKPAMEDIVDEIRPTVSLYGTVGATEGEGLKQIHLSGRWARFPGLRALLQEKLSVPISLTEPFRGFAVNKNIDKNFLADVCFSFAVVAGDPRSRRPGDNDSRHLLVGELVAGSGGVEN